MAPPIRQFSPQVLTKADVIDEGRQAWSQVFIAGVIPEAITAALQGLCIRKVQSGTRACSKAQALQCGKKVPSSLGQMPAKVRMVCDAANKLPPSFTVFSLIMLLWNLSAQFRLVPFISLE